MEEMENKRKIEMKRRQNDERVTKGEGGRNKGSRWI